MNRLKMLCVLNRNIKRIRLKVSNEEETESKAKDFVYLLHRSKPKELSIVKENGICAIIIINRFLEVFGSIIPRGI